MKLRKCRAVPPELPRQAMSAAHRGYGDLQNTGIQENALRKHLQEQEKQNQMMDKISCKEYENLFKSQAG